VKTLPLTFRDHSRKKNQNSWWLPCPIQPSINSARVIWVLRRSLANTRPHTMVPERSHSDIFLQQKFKWFLIRNFVTTSSTHLIFKSPGHRTSDPAPAGSWILLFCMGPEPQSKCIPTFLNTCVWFYALGDHMRHQRFFIFFSFFFSGSEIALITTL
jgi:hypothetical protein